MTPGDALLLLGAGVAAGLTASMAGLASLVSYPALLAVGLDPVAANVTNTVALIFQGAGTVLGSRPELAPPRSRRLVRDLLPPAAAGGVTGGLLLLATPAAAFEVVVPGLIGAASIAVLLPTGSGRRPPSDPTGTGPAPEATSPSREGRGLRLGAFAVSVYGGYFGAAAGVLMLALLLRSTGVSLRHASAVRSVLLLAANGVAAVSFLLFGPIDLAAAAPLAAGLAVGGRTGPVLLRRLPPGPVRAAIAVLGLGLALHLAGVDGHLIP